MMCAPFIDRLGRDFRDRAEDALQPMGLRLRSLEILVNIHEAGYRTQQQLSQELGIQRTNIVAALVSLEEAGLVARHRVVGDQRRHAVAVTEQGAAAIERAHQTLNQIEEDLLGQLPGRDRETLASLLERTGVPAPHGWN